VLLFAATVRHAQEVLASLPPELSDVIVGPSADHRGTTKTERKKIIERFKSKKIKYLVNVNILTVGFDAPHCDVIAILRKTESVRLLQQIVGRGLRVDEGKPDCLILDYTTNIDDHCPDGDLFDPKVKARKDPGGGKIRAVCPMCEFENMFAPRVDVDDNSTIDENGYMLDLEGNRIETEHGPMPAHFGRRCWGQVRSGKLGESVRCEYRWTSKECKECYADNDIAARYCRECKAELVNPNEKLTAAFRAFKRDPMQRQTDAVLDISTRPGVSKSGNTTLRVDFTTPHRSFSIWLMTEGKTNLHIREYEKFIAMEESGIRSVTYQKEPSGFYRVHDYNAKTDDDRLAATRAELDDKLPLIESVA
jgi:DNA repair protein RadD